MKAVVLVGGFGTRLRPLTLTTPKPLLPVGHKPILEHVLTNLARAGIDEAVLSLGFNPDAFRVAYPDDLCAGVRLVYAVEPEPLDTAGAIRFAALADGLAETFVVVNGDVITDLDVAELTAFHERHGGEATIHLTPVDDPSAFGVVPTGTDGRVLAFIEKPRRDEAPTNLINAGTYVLEPSVLDRIPSDRRVSIERETFPAMAGERCLYAMPTDDYWVDTGRPDLYVKANVDLLLGRRRLDRCDAFAADAHVSGSSSVTHSIVGSGSHVGVDARVDGSVLMAGVRVGEGAVVRSSAIGRGTKIGAGAVLIDTVVGDGVTIEPGAVLSGARVPEPV
jgi:mannose-1-phosphate guanylyltransferase